MKLRPLTVAGVATMAVSAAWVLFRRTCQGDPCVFTVHETVTAYRLPDETSTPFTVFQPGDAWEVLARTADGWLGWDPGVAQAGNIGLARHRWVRQNISVSPSCLDSVPLVTLAEVQADLDASHD